MGMTILETILIVAIAWSVGLCMGMKVIRDEALKLGHARKNSTGDFVWKEEK